MAQPAVGFGRVLIEAYRRACRAGVDEIGTDVVLYYAVPRVRVLRDRLPGRRDAGWKAAIGGSAGLADPQPPPLTRLAPDFDEDVAFEADAVLREAAYLGSNEVRRRRRRGGSEPVLPSFTPAVRYAVYEAIHEAQRRGINHARRKISHWGCWPYRTVLRLPWRPGCCRSGGFLGTAWRRPYEPILPTACAAPDRMGRPTS